MKHPMKIILIIVCFALSLSAAFLIGMAAGSENSEESITLVSLDYLEALVDELRGGLSAVDDAALLKIESIKGKLSEMESEYSGRSDSYDSITLSQSKKIVLSRGCELVLTSGHAVIESGTACDSSDGAVISAGDDIEKNHLCITTSETVISADSGEITVLVKGEYKNG